MARRRKSSKPIVWGSLSKELAKRLADAQTELLGIQQDIQVGLLDLQKQLQKSVHNSQQALQTIAAGLTQLAKYEETAKALDVLSRMNSDDIQRVLAFKKEGAEAKPETPPPAPPEPSPPPSEPPPAATPQPVIIPEALRET